MHMPRLFDLLHRAHAATLRHHNRVTRREAGVSTLELGALWTATRPVGVVSLAERLGIDPAAATRLVDQLERKGLVERRPDPQDARRRVVHRTDAGTTTARTGSGLVELANTRLREGFTDDELQLVARFLTHLITLSEDP